MSVEPSEWTPNTPYKNGDRVLVDGRLCVMEAPEPPLEPTANERMDAWWRALGGAS